MHYINFKLILFCLLLPLTGLAQLNEPAPCGTQDGKSDWLIQYQQNPGLFPNLADTIYVPLTIHLVGDDSGFGYFNENLLFQVLCILNADFAEAEIQFYIKGDINYIANSTYNEHNYNQGFQMMNENNVFNTINCYIVDDPAGACGYSAYGLGIALNESCNGVNDHTWAHEIGHFLSLPHTFFGWEGYTHDYNEPAPTQVDNAVETVNGNNCGFAGDGFCDTPADYLNYRWTCGSDNFSTTSQIDPNGETFNSDGSYFMSYARDECMSQFSVEQMDAMRANLLTEKIDYLYQDVILGPIDVSSFTVISPEDESIVDNYSNVVFEWEPITNAVNYTVELSPFPNFTLVLFRYETTDTKVITNELPPNYELYWRVKASSNWYTCLTYTEGQFFTTGSLTSVNDRPSVTSLQVSPIPVSSGESLKVTFNLEKDQTIEMILLNVAGTRLESLHRRFFTGNQTAFISTSNLSPGVYVLQLKGETGTISRKVVVAR